MDADGIGDVRRVETAGEDHRQLPGDRRGHPFRRANAGATGVWPAGGVEEEAFDTAGEVGVAAGNDVSRRGRGRRCVVGRVRGKVEDLPGRPPNGAR